LSIGKKFGLAMVAFAVLALLSWLTLSNDPIRDTLLGFEVEIRFRTATLTFLGLLAALTGISSWRNWLNERREQVSQQD
jgi:DMSO/TMAO reductase YedYZ heme-binding membrane subunit